MPKQPEQASIIEEENQAPRLIARLNALAVKVMFPFIASDDIRHYLNGLNARPLRDGGVMLSASNGAMIACIRDPDAFLEEELIIRIDKDALKHCAASNTFDLMSNGAAMINDENGLPLFVQPGQSLISKGDGAYPRPEKILTLQGYEDGLRHTVNPQYLEAALKIGKAFGAIRFFSRADKAPIVFTLSALGGLEACGAIMPMDEGVSCLPTWLPKAWETEE